MVWKSHLISISALGPPGQISDDLLFSRDLESSSKSFSFALDRFFLAAYTGRWHLKRQRREAAGSFGQLAVLFGRSLAP